MRTPEQWAMALRGWRRLGAWTLAGMAAGLLALCAGLNGLFAVAGEKAQPCELTATAASITDAMWTEVGKLEYVEAVTPVIEVAGTLHVGEYMADIPMAGVQPEYIAGQMLEGSVFPSQSGMPYLVLNEAALEAFVEEKGAPPKKEQPLDWRNAETLIGEENPLTAKISGVVSDGREEPAAYVAISAAKDMAIRQGSTAAYTALRLRIANVGFEAEAISGLGRLGLAAQSADEAAQAAWEALEVQGIFAVAAGALILLFAGAAGAAHIRADFAADGGAYTALRSMGMSLRELRSMLRMRCVLAAVLALLAAWLVAVCVPSFLEKDATGVFAVAFSPWTLAITALAVALQAAALAAAASVRMKMRGAC